MSSVTQESPVNGETSTSHNGVGKHMPALNKDLSYSPNSPPPIVAGGSSEHINGETNSNNLNGNKCSSK